MAVDDEQEEATVGAGAETVVLAGIHPVKYQSAEQADYAGWGNVKEADLSYIGTLKG
jgi:hypothetical protein